MIVSLKLWEWASSPIRVLVQTGVRYRFSSIQPGPTFRLTSKPRQASHPRPARTDQVRIRQAKHQSHNKREASFHSNSSITISGFDPSRSGGPQVPAPLEVKTCIFPIRLKPYTNWR